MICEVVYRVKYYTLADAMRPNPFWGKRIFRADTDKLGTDVPEAIWEAAAATPPDERYECFSVQVLPGGKLYHGPRIEGAQDAAPDAGGAQP